MKILITTYPFGDDSDLSILQQHSLYFNEKKSKYDREEIINRVKEVNPDIIIAGTEKYDSELLNATSKLQMISRVGMGVDSIDLPEAKNRNIAIYNTPMAPINAVANLTIGMAYSLSRKISQMNHSMHLGEWKRITARDISDLTVGIIGFGNIGRKVYEKFLDQGVTNFQIYDPYQQVPPTISANDLESLLALSDLVTLHIPKTEKTTNLIGKKELELMKKDAIIINTSRGGIIDEKALYNHVLNNLDFSVGLDVYEQEPGTGGFEGLVNVLLTPHIATQTQKTRTVMENDSMKNIEAYLSNDKTYRVV